MSQGPHAITIAWGEEEQSLRLSRHAGVAARLSGFRDDVSHRLCVDVSSFAPVSRRLYLVRDINFL